LVSFDHAKCDAILQLRHIDLGAAYNPDKAQGWRDPVYFGFWWVSIWETCVIFSWVRVWRKSYPSHQGIIQRFALPSFAIFGLVCLCIQLTAMVDYADTCKTYFAKIG
jgi:hypothetical protein